MASLTQAAQAATMMHDLETGEIFQSEENKQNKQWWEKLGFVALLCVVVCSACIVFNILALVFQSTGAVYPMAILALLMAPTVMKRQIEMDDKGGLRFVHNELRETVNVLSTENTKLCGRVNVFVEQVNKLKHVETELAEIVKDSKQDINSFVQLVKENGELMEQFKRAILAQAVNIVVNVFLESDRDESGHLDENEQKVLAFRLSQLEGTNCHQELFQEKLKEDSTMSGILAVLRASIKKDVKPEDQVFTFEANA